MQAIGGHYTKRTENLQPGECIELCKKDNTCKSVNIDYKESTCEYFDESNTVIDVQIKSQEEKNQIGLQQQNQFNIQQNNPYNLQQQQQQQKGNQQQLVTGIQVKNRSLSIFSSSSSSSSSSGSSSS